MLIGAGLLGAWTATTSGWSAPSDGGSCARASRELRAAQVALSAAVRRADEANHAYHECVQRKRAHPASSCRAEKRAADDATDARSCAHASYQAAVERHKASCGR